jgi:hypothetical protein
MAWFIGCKAYLKRRNGGIGREKEACQNHRLSSMLPSIAAIASYFEHDFCRAPGSIFRSAWRGVDDTDSSY